ncbi:unnamed protein product, partial [Strongylus vulgaris]
YQYTNDTYPVIVFIHGGDFQSGGGSDYPQQAILDNFVSRKIIFVTFNYRLGPLGFLSTGDKILPGNIGLWDQIWALKWVKANAEVFGGDPGNILLMGSGSGAACASILALSPRTEGLFHKILLMSGSALQPGVVRDTAINATWALNEKMQCRMREEILDYKRLHWDDYQEFVPVIDGPGGVIPDAPEDLAKHRKKIPMMIGTTRDESSLRIRKTISLHLLWSYLHSTQTHMNITVILNEKNVNFSALNTPLAEKLADNLTMGYKQFQNHRLIAEGCKAQYVWTKVDPSMSINILFDSVLKMYSHFWYDAPASRLATYYAKQKVPVFLYSFDHISENFQDYDRAFHGADKLHLFNITPRFLSRRKDRNWQLDQRVVEIFADLIVGYRWQGHVFWNWYARSLDAVDVGNLQRIAQLDRDVGNWQVMNFSVEFFT